MAKKKTKKQAAADREARRRGVRAGVAAVVVLGIGAGAMFGVGALDERAARELRAPEGAIEIVWPALEAQTPDGETTWMPRSERERLRLMIEEILRDTDPLSPDPIRDAGEALMATGWFRGAPTVRRLADQRVEVRGTWRLPAAAVRTTDGDRLISWDGAPLALIYGRGESGQRLIVGGQYEPARRGVWRADAEGRWPSEDVLEGLELLAMLREQGLDEQVQAVDVSGFRRDRTLELVTFRGGRVAWGSGVGTFTPGEVSDEIKLERLRTLRARTGQIDAGKARIEIFGPKVLLDRTSG
ncbi:MAG: hypothetical protein ACIARR_05240 [Phycisphaerales bacterium JB059]